MRTIQAIVDGQVFQDSNFDETNYWDLNKPCNLRSREDHIRECLEAEKAITLRGIEGTVILGPRVAQRTIFRTVNAMTPINP